MGASTREWSERRTRTFSTRQRWRIAEWTKYHDGGIVRWVIVSWGEMEGGVADGEVS